MYDNFTSFFLVKHVAGKTIRSRNVGIYYHRVKEGNLLKTLSLWLAILHISSNAFLPAQSNTDSSLED